MYKSFEPHQDLSAFVECYWSWGIAPDDAALDDILPDAAPEFIVHFGATPLVQDACGVWRQQGRAFLYCAAHKAVRLSIREPMRIFAIRFRPWGVSRFSNVSMANMLDRAVPPSESFCEIGDQLVEGLSSAATDIDRVKVADKLLMSALQTCSPVEPRLRLLLDAAKGGRCSSAEMARTLAVSDRSFSRLWHDVVGIQPRKFMQLMRFHTALELIDSGTRLSQVAADCGYSDQAHMARQIKKIAGLPPSALRRRLGNRVYRDLYASRPGAPWRDPGDQSTGVG